MEPFPHPVHISPCQVVLPLEQQEPLVLEFEALPGGQILANALAQLLQRVVRHALDMESIDHDPGLWQRGAHHLPINVVHVHRHPLDRVLVPQVAEIGHQLGFGPAGADIEHGLALDVGDHGPVLADDLELVDTQHPRRPELGLGLDLLDEIVEDVADRLFVHGYFPGKGRKGLGEGLVADITHQTRRGLAFSIKVRHRLKQGLGAACTAIATALDEDHDGFAVRRCVLKRLFL